MLAQGARVLSVVDLADDCVVRGADVLDVEAAARFGRGRCRCRPSTSTPEYSPSVPA
jgi:hypothetical protein